MSDPRRLIDQDDLEGSLLRSAREDGPSPAAKRALGIALGIAPIAPIPHVAPPAVATSTGTGAATTIVAKAGVPIAVKVLAILGVGVGVGLGVRAGVEVVYSPSMHEPPSALPRITAPAAIDPPPQPTAPVAPAPTPPRTQPALAPSPRVPRAIPAPSPAPIPSADIVRGEAPQENPAPPEAPAPLLPVTSPPLPTETLADEVAALDAAREALRAHDATKALATIDQYTARFPTGVLAPEAVVVRIEALFEAGRTSDARALAAHYLASHADSPIAQRVRTLIASHPDTR